MAKLHLVIGNKNYSSWSLRPWLAMTMAGLDFDETLILLDAPDTVFQSIRSKESPAAGVKARPSTSTPSAGSPSRR